MMISDFSRTENIFWKRGKCWLPAFPSFLTMFSKLLCSWVVKTRDTVEKMLKKEKSIFSFSNDVFKGTLLLDRKNSGLRVKRAYFLAADRVLYKKPKMFQPLSYENDIAYDYNTYFNLSNGIGWCLGFHIKQLRKKNSKIRLLICAA